MRGNAEVSARCPNLAGSCAKPQNVSEKQTQKTLRAVLPPYRVRILLHQKRKVQEGTQRIFLQFFYNMTLRHIVLALRLPTSQQLTARAVAIKTLWSAMEPDFAGRMGSCTKRDCSWGRAAAPRVCRSAPTDQAFRFFLLLCAVTFLASPLTAREKNKVDYGMGLTVSIPAPESEVEQVVADVAQNGIIRGTKEYNKDEYVTGAVAADSCEIFPHWTEGGKIFFKVRKEALDPRNFKDSSDIGTLAVRYVVQGHSDKNTVLRIDALFMEDFRRVVHLSNGSVEVAEYEDIKNHVDAIDLMKTQTVEAERERQEEREQKAQPSAVSEMPRPVAQPATEPVRVEVDSPEATAPPPSAAPAETLEQHVRDLRRQVERIVKAPGAPLKSAPFHTASTLQTLPSGTEVLIVISTPYWMGVETHDGQHGWIPRDSLEMLP